MNHKKLTQLVKIHHFKNKKIYIFIYVFHFKGKPLPPILYIQMDNCWRENKNQYVLGFCALLVKLKIVIKVCPIIKKNMYMYFVFSFFFCKKL